jgi:hypothetical protein
VKLSDESPYSIQQFASQLIYDLRVGNGTHESKAVSGCSYRKVAALTRIFSTPFAAYASDGDSSETGTVQSIKQKKEAGTQLSSDIIYFSAIDNKGIKLGP